MTSGLVICKIQDEVKQVLKKFRFAKTTSMDALILKIDRESHELIVDETFDDCELDDVKESLPSQQPRFVIVSWKKQHSDRVSYPLMIVYYCPNGSSPELQMMYAGSMNYVVNEIQLTRTAEVRDVDEIDMELLDKKS